MTAIFGFLPLRTGFERSSISEIQPSNWVRTPIRTAFELGSNWVRTAFAHTPHTPLAFEGAQTPSLGVGLAASHAGAECSRR